ncbi:MAG: hypothetical protein ACYTXA_01500 [Nostoc sp.]
MNKREIRVFMQGGFIQTEKNYNTSFRRSQLGILNIKYSFTPVRHSARE